jgi:hypothetical protein
VNASTKAWISVHKASYVTMLTYLLRKLCIRAQNFSIYKIKDSITGVILMIKVFQILEGNSNMKVGASFNKPNYYLLNTVIQRLIDRIRKETKMKQLRQASLRNS